nr:hypothetical protein [Tanacetum cinerariifolium]
IISRLPETKEAIRTVDKTLTQCRQSNLHKFHIRSSHDVRFESPFNNWIPYAVSRNVQDLELNLPMFALDQSYLSEGLIQNILSGSPLLETLELKDCYGFSRIDITSKSVKNFVFSRFRDYGDIFEINAPYIVSLTIADDLWLSKLLLVDVSCLVKAHLDYKLDENFEPIWEWEVLHEDLLEGLILDLRHVKELKIGESCLEVNFI